jgi:hypothetical protein
VHMRITGLGMRSRLAPARFALVYVKLSGTGTRGDDRGWGPRMRGRGCCKQ